MSLMMIGLAVPLLAVLYQAFKNTENGVLRALLILAIMLGSFWIALWGLVLISGLGL